MPSSNQLPKKGLTSRLSNHSTPASQGSPPSASRQGSATPTGNRLPRPTMSTFDGRPRWNSSVNTKDTIIGHNFTPLSLTTPSPHAKTTPVLKKSSSSNLSSRESKIPLLSPLSRDPASSPIAESTPSRTSNPRLSLSNRLTSPGPYSQQVLSANRPRSLQTQASMSALSTNRRASFHPSTSSSTVGSPPTQPTISRRPASSLATSKRVSLLPQPRGRQGVVTGKESPDAVTGAALAMRRGSSQTSTESKGKERPKWR